MNKFPLLDEVVFKGHFPATRAYIGNEQTFEVGLALAATIAAGAYTAGVLDFIMEALDAWTAAKDKARKSNEPIPFNHSVVISNISGASGGAVNAAILLRSLNYSYSHGPFVPGVRSGNPFYAAWVKGPLLADMLGPNTPAGVSGPASLLDCKKLVDVATDAICYTGTPLAVPRDYMADKTRIMMSVGNLTGIPYEIPFTGGGNLAHQMIAHADVVRFAVNVNKGFVLTPQTDLAVRNDETLLTTVPNPTNDAAWMSLRDASLASCAFPGAFESRVLRRPLTQFQYRAIALPGAGGGEVRQLAPRLNLLQKLQPDGVAIPFVNVDGGVVNNEPFDLVHKALSGYLGVNPRNGAEARRAVVLIDPFTDEESNSLGNGIAQGVLGTLTRLLLSLVEQSRFKPVDLVLSGDENVYSRFLIAPHSPDPMYPNSSQNHIWGSGALATGGMYGFVGFIDHSFMDYDFALGRQNAYDYLTMMLSLPPNNPLFANWTNGEKQNMMNLKGELPIIPVLASIPRPVLPNWPKMQRGNADGQWPGNFGTLIDQRLDTLYSRIQISSFLTKYDALKPLFDGVLKALWATTIRPLFRKVIMDELGKGLQSRNLI